MKRLHVHVGVTDLDQSIRFYSGLFASEPTMRKDDYAKWMLDDPRVNFAISTRQDGAGVRHLGIQVETPGELAEVYERLKAATRGERISKVGVEQVSRLLTSCAQSTITTIEGPKDVVGPQLDELGYAYEVVEWKANGEDLLWKYDPKAAKQAEKDKLKAEKKKAKDAAKKSDDDAAAQK